jgi:hypothetical protein
MHLRADADMEISDSESDSDGWIGVPTPLSVQVLAEGGADGFESFANVGGLAEAFWAPDGSSGSVLFDDYGWDVSVSDAAYSVKLNEHGDGDDWTYTFVADADGVFSMEYLVTAPPSASGAGPSTGAVSVAVSRCRGTRPSAPTRAASSCATCWRARPTRWG